MKNKKILITFLAIFLVALALRTIGLGKVGILADEERWIDRGSEYINQTMSGNFTKATRNFERHPGIPAAVLIGVSVKFFSDGGPEKYKYEVPPLSKYSLRLMEPLTAARLPIAILGALSAGLLFFFVFKIWQNYSLALFSGFFLALDPFHISISKMAHQDVALSLFFMLTIFTYFLGIKENKNSLRILAGVFFGLAFLTKIVAVVLPLSILLWKIIESFKTKENRQKLLQKKLPIDLIDLAILFIGVLMFFAFYTKMWLNPADGFINHLLMNLEERNLRDPYFYFGETRNNASFTFYLTNIFIRLTELAAVSLLIGFFIGIYKIVKKKSVKSIVLLSFLACFITWFLLSLTGKMKDRYIMPLWPFLAIVEASGLIFTLKIVLKKYFENKKIIYGIAAILFIIFSIRPLISFYPYYFLYYNKFIGNIKNAEKITLVSRGEGMKEAAEYLNQKENASQLSAIATYRESFSPYFKGTLKRIKEDEWRAGKKTPTDIDYVVFFVRGVQKENFGALYKRFVENSTPEKIINLKGLDVAYIYKVKK